MFAAVVGGSFFLNVFLVVCVGIVVAILGVVIILPLGFVLVVAIITNNATSIGIASGWFPNTLCRGLWSSMGEDFDTTALFLFADR